MDLLSKERSAANLYNFNFMKFINKKIVGLALLVGATAVLLIQPFSSQAEVSQATRDYLHTQALSDWVVMGLAATGEQNFDLGYLAQGNPQSATDYARAILAITAANQNPITTGGRDWLAGLRRFFNNNQFGSERLINDDIWAVLALRSSGAEVGDVQVVAAKNFILANQNQDGGWSYQVGLASDGNDTAAAIMALRVGGLAAQDEIITRALDYLRTTQNVDGGFGYDANADSDGASTAWLISGLQSIGQDPAAWSQATHTPISFLQSLALPDGSYRWAVDDQVGSLITTVYAAIALTNHFYPVRLWQPVNDPGPTLPQVTLRIESPNNNLCQTTVSATSVLNALVAGADICHYTVHITNSAFGQYVSGINDWTASGTRGWMYRLNWQDSDNGAAIQPIQSNDQILWFYGEYTDQPLRLTLDRTTANVGELIRATVEKFNGHDWQAASGTNVIFGNQAVAANNQGQASWQVAGFGAISVVADGAGFIRSQAQTLTIGGSGGGGGGGGGVSQTVNLQVDLLQPTGGGSVAFQVTQANLGFGSLRPGEVQSRSNAITNVGQGTIRLTGQVSGDQFFSANLKLDNQPLGTWSLDLAPNQTATVTASLLVPANSLERGQKNGRLIYWAQSR